MWRCVRKKNSADVQSQCMFYVRGNSPQPHALHKRTRSIWLDGPPSKLCRFSTNCLTIFIRIIDFSSFFVGVFFPIAQADECVSLLQIYDWMADFSFSFNFVDCSYLYLVWHQSDDSRAVHERWRSLFVVNLSLQKRLHLISKTRRNHHRSYFRKKPRSRLSMNAINDTIIYLIFFSKRKILFFAIN